MPKLDQTELLRDLHHAVKSPLSSIFNLTEMLLLGIEAETSIQIQQDMQTIAADTQRLQQVVDRMLDFIGTVTTDYPVQPLEVTALLDSLANRFDLPLVVPLPTIMQSLNVMGNADALNVILQKLCGYICHTTGCQRLVIEMQSEGDLLQFAISPEETAVGTTTGRASVNSLDLLLCEHLLRLQGGALWFNTSVAPNQKTLCFALPKSK